MYNIDPELAKKCYYDAKARLEELEKKRAILLANGMHSPELDRLINSAKNEVDGCAYYAFGKR